MEQPNVRLKEDQNIWNLLFVGIFALVVLGAFVILWKVRGMYPTSVSVFDTVLMVLAAFRLTRLVVYDKITRFIRELFLDKREFVENGRHYLELIPAQQGVRRTLHDLVDCPWCVGMWSALAVAFSYFMFPWAWFAILCLAIAGASSFIQVTANAVGWDAELGKLEVRQKVLPNNHP